MIFYCCNCKENLENKFKICLMDETSLFTGLKKRKTWNKTRQNTCPKKKDKI